MNREKVARWLEDEAEKRDEMGDEQSANHLGFTADWIRSKADELLALLGDGEPVAWVEFVQTDEVMLRTSGRYPILDTLGPGKYHLYLHPPTGCEVERLKKALRPFAEHGEMLEGCCPTDQWCEAENNERTHWLAVQHFLDAATAYATEGGEDG